MVCDYNNKFEMAMMSSNLQPHQEEMLKLAELAGINADPAVVMALVELLNLEIEPEAIFKVLKLLMKRARNAEHKSRASRRLKSKRDVSP